MKKIITLGVATAMMASLAIAKEVKIGVILPMSGPIGGFGQSAHKGLTFANKMNHTLKNGDTVKLVLVDNKSDKIESANAASKLISDDKVTAIIGALTSTNTMAMTKIAEEAKVPVVAPVATNILVTKRKDYVSRVCFSDAFQGTVAANFAIKELKEKEAVLITDVKLDYSIGISKVFSTEYKKLGGNIVQRVKINSGDTDFKAMLSNIKALNPKLIFFPIYSAEAGLIAKQAKQLGITAKFLGTDGMTADKIFFETAGDAAEGFYGTNLFSSDAPKTTDLSKKYDKEFTAKYNEPVHPFGVLSADSYNVIINAMNQCKDPTNSICVNEKIRATKNFQGASGIISLEEGDAVRSAVINQIVNGKEKFLTLVNP
ncbi:ABC transporter substrate-binding protein [Malaciobacter mytili]|uniref:ABC transporter substrate-binding protein n=1 Tax=Malaciobacter mytili TaxID=603050 RepID=UPI003A8A49CA